MRRFYNAMFCAFLAFGVVGITTNTNYDHGQGLVKHELSVCRHSGAQHCHTEQDTDGVVRVYGLPCLEDEPCWDCHTMGNHVCGVPALPAGAEGQG